MIYLVRRIAETGTGPVAIGYATASGVRHRLAAIKTGGLGDLRLCGITAGNRADVRTLYDRFAPLRIEGEWFRYEEPLVTFVENLGPLPPAAEQLLAPGTKAGRAAAAMTARIRSGEWDPGRKLPTVADLEREFRISRGTVFAALAGVAHEGLIYKRGNGWYVERRRPSR